MSIQRTKRRASATSTNQDLNPPTLLLKIDYCFLGPDCHREPFQFMEHVTYFQRCGPSVNTFKKPWKNFWTRITPSHLSASTPLPPLPSHFWLWIVVMFRENHYSWRWIYVPWNYWNDWIESPLPRFEIQSGKLGRDTGFPSHLSEGLYKRVQAD